MEKLLLEKSNMVFSMWHGNELALIAFSDRYKLVTMTSTSKDGEIMDFILKKLGFKTSRGSTTRGGVSALKGLLRIAKEGYTPMIPVDGPKGPIYEPKPGVFELSKLLNAPILPTGVAASSSLVFKKSWNKAFLPLPFSKVVLVWGEPMAPVQEGQDPRSIELATQLKTALDACGQSAKKYLTEDSGKC